MFLTIPNITRLLKVMERGVQQKAVRQEWPFESRAEGKGYPAHYYPLNQLPDYIQLAYVKADDMNKEKAKELLTWPIRTSYYQSKPKQYDGYSIGISAEVRELLLEKYPELSDIDPAPDSKPLPKAEGSLEQKTTGGKESQNKDSYIGVKFFDDVNAAAAQGASMGQGDSGNQVQVSQSMIDLLIPGNPKKDLSMIRVHGDSMEPKIKEGDLILVSMSQDVIYDGSIYILRVGDVVYVKRVQRLPTQINLVSDNKAYATIAISGEELKQVEVIGQVVGKINVEQF